MTFKGVEDFGDDLQHDIDREMADHGLVIIFQPLYADRGSPKTRIWAKMGFIGKIRKKVIKNSFKTPMDGKHEVFFRCTTFNEDELENSSKLIVRHSGWKSKPVKYLLSLKIRKFNYNNDYYNIKQLFLGLSRYKPDQLVTFSNS